MFERFIKSIYPNLCKTHEYIIDRVSLPKAVKPETVKDVLWDAREARNWLAHEAPEDFESKFATTDAWDEWSNTLRERLLQIAEGKQVVAFLRGRVTSDAMPTRATLAQYPDRIIAWVMAE